LGLLVEGDVLLGEFVNDGLPLVGGLLQAVDRRDQPQRAAEDDDEDDQGDRPADDADDALGPSRVRRGAVLLVRGLRELVVHAQPPTTFTMMPPMEMTAASAARPMESHFCAFWARAVRSIV